MARLQISKRRACAAASCNRRVFQYVRLPNDDAAIMQRLEELAAERRRFGYHRLHVLLLREGFKLNMKRTRRIYKAANLQVRRRLKRRVALGRGNPASGRPTQLAVVSRFRARHAASW
jgi:putative transposase